MATTSTNKPSFDIFKKKNKFYTEEHEMFRTSLQKFLAKEAAPFFDQWEEEGLIPREFYHKLGEQGFLCPQVDPKYGGLGLDFAFNFVLMEELLRVGGGLGGAALHNGIVVPYLEHFGSEELKQKYLPKCVSGEIITAVAMTEPGSGSDLASMSTRAVKEADHYIINGAKTFITNGFTGELIFLAVKTDPNAVPAHKGISIILVDTDTPGFSRGRKLKKLGRHSQDTAELIFEDVRVPITNLLGEEGKGFYYLMNKLRQERLMVAGSAVTVAEEMLRQTIDYVKARKAFGKPISSFQNTQFEIAEMATEISLARTFVEDLSFRHFNDEPVDTEVAMAKWWITDMTRRMSARCLQLHGGYGFMEEYDIARRYRDSAVMPIVAGSNEIMKTIIAKNMGL